MKKLYSLFIAGVLMAALVFPAFAAPSPVAEVKPSTSSATVEDAIKAGTTDTVSVEGVSYKAASKPLYDAVIELAKTAEHMQNLGIAGSNIVVKQVVEVSFDKDNIPAGGVKIPFKVADAKSGDYAYILHRLESGQWEVVGQGYLGDDLTITGTFTSFSPVAIVIGDAPSGTGSTAKAPKTGE